MCYAQHFCGYFLTGVPAVIALAALSGTSVLNAADRPDKSGYNLFRPTPRELMRELSTDRPDQTESAYTVDAGHVQMEADAFSGTFDRTDDFETSELVFGGVNFKVGLLNRVDLQLVIDSYVETRIEDRASHAVARASGVGDFQTRIKINLWGNDEGRTALALMPFVKWPLPESGVRNGKTEGGLIIPFAADLGKGWGLGAITEFDLVSDSRGEYDVEYFNTITVGRDLVGNLGAYIEFAARVTPGSDSDWQGQVDLGFTYGLSRDVQLDAGCNFGITKSAPDFNPFVGFSFRY
jgi:hypothetical protein